MTKSPKFAFIKAQWHADIVDQALIGFQQRLAELGLDATVDVFDVPGAFEMPLLAQKLAATGDYDAVAAAALVVDGGLYRHDFVAQAVVSGLMDAGLKTGVLFYPYRSPHITSNPAKSITPSSRSLREKGREAADAAARVTDLHRELVPVRPLRRIWRRAFCAAHTFDEPSDGLGALERFIRGFGCASACRNPHAPSQSVSHTPTPIRSCRGVTTGNTPQPARL